MYSLSRRWPKRRDQPPNYSGFFLSNHWGALPFSLITQEHVDTQAALLSIFWCDCFQSYGTDPVLSVSFWHLTICFFRTELDMKDLLQPFTWQWKCRPMTNFCWSEYTWWMPTQLRIKGSLLWMLYRDRTIVFTVFTANFSFLAGCLDTSRLLSVVTRFEDDGLLWTSFDQQSSISDHMLSYGSSTWLGLVGRRSFCKTANITDTSRITSENGTRPVKN